MAISNFEFSRRWTDSSPETGFKTFEPDEATVRADMQLLFDELAAYINTNITPRLNSDESSFSSIGDAITNILQQLVDMTQGSVADKAITANKIADGGAAGWEDITNSVDLELVTQVGGVVQSLSLIDAKFRYSRTLGIVAFEFILSGEITGEKEIDLQHTAYNCDSFGGSANCMTQHGSKCGVELFYNSGHTTHSVHLWEAHTGGIIVNGWYFCDGPGEEEES